MGSSRMGLSRTGSVLGSFGCCEWDHHDGEIVANGIVAIRFGVGIVCWDRSVLGSSRIGSLKLHFVVVYPSLMHIVQ